MQSKSQRFYEVIYEQAYQQGIIMKKMTSMLALFTIAVFFIGYYALRANTPDKKFAIILQAGKETHEGMARAVHALLYATELKEKGYEVVLIFDGAGTEWAEEFSNPDSQTRLLPMYKAFKKTGAQEIICDFCAGAFGVKEKLKHRQCPIVSEYQGHPSIEKWIKKGYKLLIL